jgi:predicted Zn-dependent protease
MPAPVVKWVEGGTLVNLSHSRFWAQQSGRAFTGSPTNILMAGADQSLDDLIAGTAEGLLITRFWYIRFVDPMKLLLTGMSRDGLFEVRDGQVTGGVKNMRFNDSPLRVFANIAATGKPVPAGSYGRGLVPPAKVEGFTFSSGTAF